MGKPVWSEIILYAVDWGKEDPEGIHDELGDEVDFWDTLDWWV